MPTISRFGIVVFVEDQDRAMEKYRTRLGLSAIETLLRDDPFFTAIQAIPLFYFNGNYVVIMDDGNLYFIDHEMVSQDCISVFNGDPKNPKWHDVEMTNTNIKQHCLIVGSFNAGAFSFNDAFQRI